MVTEGQAFVLMILCLFVGAMLMLLVMAANHATYRDGQIDYANGKIMYCLEKNDNNENVWTYCEEGK